MVALDRSISTILMQFSFGNPRAVPEWIRTRRRETLEESGERRNRSSRTPVIEPTESCDLLQFVEDLRTSGYELVDAFCQRRPDKDPPGKLYYAVRFMFCRSEHIDPCDSHPFTRVALRELQGMCSAALWRVRAFLNPYFENNREVPGEHTISISLEARQPLRSPEGGPRIMLWPRDEFGRSMKDRPGVEKVPLGPDFRLCIQENDIRLVKA